MDSDTALVNPTYTTTTPPSVQYSIMGPRDIPASHTPEARSDQGGTPYEVPVVSKKAATQKGEGEGEGMNVYEVPIPRAARPSTFQKREKGDKKLNYNKL